MDGFRLCIYVFGLIVDECDKNWLLRFKTDLHPKITIQGGKKG